MEETTKQKPFTKTARYSRTLKVSYPCGKGRLVIRSEEDWERNIEAVSISEDGNTSTFQLETHKPFLYLEPCLVGNDGSFYWHAGVNKLLLMEEKDERIMYPFFFGSDQGRFADLLEFHSEILGCTHSLRVYLPPGYDENSLAVYPVAFMQGESNYFPDDAFQHTTWEVNEASPTRQAICMLEDVVIVGIKTGDGIKEYTQVECADHGRSLVEEIVPRVQRTLRIEDHRRYRSVWGASLGSIVSFSTVWQYPDVFGAGVCMSSAFSDELIEQVLEEPTRDVAFYFDSSWPGDNYERTMSMAVALASRGWKYGVNLLQTCLAHPSHNDQAWGARLCSTIQFLNGALACSARTKQQMLLDNI